MEKIALITGANKGMGLEVARQLAEEGMTVLVGSRSLERGEAAAAELRSSGLDAHVIELDVTDDESINRAATRIENEFDRLDVLVNNAGIAGEEGANTAPSSTTRAGMQQIFETNVFGLVAVTNAVLPLLRKTDSARIVNVSSEVASLTTITNPSSGMYEMFDMAYPASKTAVNMVTTMYAKELRGTGVKVNASIPGYVQTDLNGGAGMISASEGAAVTVALALLPDDGPTGEYWGSLLTNEPGARSVAPW
jgi:NAD(P)-dependent dehydrogenase (short-subunit alcohol dehydrogenase family)